MEPQRTRRAPASPLRVVVPFVTMVFYVGCIVPPAQATYVDAVLGTPGLVGYWRFEADTQANSSVNGFTGAFEGDAAVSAPGQGAPLAGLPENRAVVLDGNGSYLATDLDTEATFADAATFLVWVYLDVQPSQAGRIFTIAGKSEYGNDLDLQIEPDDYTKFFTDSQTSTAYTMPLPTQQWVHVAATFDDQADFRRIYVDGVRVANEEPMLRDRAPGATAFSIGESLVFRGRFFQGRLDEVALFQRALSDQEIAAIYQSSFPTPTPTPTETATRTSTPTVTRTLTPTAPPTPTGTPTMSVPPTLTPTDSATPLPSVTGTPTVTVTATPTPSATPTAPSCVGDCDGDGATTIDELITMVNVALGTADVTVCAAGDANGDGAVSIDELVQGVNASLQGCAPPPATCGGLAGLPCPTGEVCDRRDPTCAVADLAGTCVTRPGACLAIYDPVCGCDGVTYGNDCERLSAGATLAHTGACS